MSVSVYYLYLSSQHWAVCKTIRWHRQFLVTLFTLNIVPVTSFMLLPLWNIYIYSGRWPFFAPLSVLLSAWYVYGEALCKVGIIKCRLQLVSLQNDILLGFLNVVLFVLLILYSYYVCHGILILWSDVIPVYVWNSWGFQGHNALIKLSNTRQVADYS